ncbi:MerR family transcriptional regulator [Christensenellaceae bacterium NSJ-44]|uniref:MerR family transcriptional regulator n=1 Tax=Luoshenia tenuis TaxID=2763654 RepID=A0A926HJE8_9FIRM|nr:MerR family transcriptional regulator [Luoshenia tenuis]MBC8529817.1 MerR family transcriptional regulator [Luoshenia tenuis]
MYTIKQAAALVGMSEHTLRFYTDKGLVPAVTRDAHNNRVFSDEALNFLTVIKCLKGCGMSIEAIKKYVDLCLQGEDTVQERYKIILAQKKVAQAQLQEAQKRIEYLQHKADNYAAILAHHTPDTMNPASWPGRSVG